MDLEQVFLSHFCIEKKPDVFSLIGASIQMGARQNPLEFERRRNDFLKMLMNPLSQDDEALKLDNEEEEEVKIVTDSVMASAVESPEKATVIRKIRIKVNNQFLGYCCSNGISEEKAGELVVTGAATGEVVVIATTDRVSAGIVESSTTIKKQSQSLAPSRGIKQVFPKRKVATKGDLTNRKQKVHSKLESIKRSITAAHRVTAGISTAIKKQSLGDLPNMNATRKRVDIAALRGIEQVFPKQKVNSSTTRRYDSIKPREFDRLTTFIKKQSLGDLKKVNAPVEQKVASNKPRELASTGRITSAIEKQSLPNMNATVDVAPMRGIGQVCPKQKVDSKFKKESLGDLTKMDEEYKFESSKRKYEETSVSLNRGKRRIVLVDFHDMPKPPMDKPSCCPRKRF